MLRPAHLLVVVCAVAAACEHPEPLDERRTSATPASSAGAGRTAATGTARPDPVADATAVEAAYRAATDPGVRFEQLQALTAAPAATAVPAIGRLLAVETDLDLRIHLLDALDVFDGEVDAKLAILAPLVTRHDQADDVHEAVLDALQNIQDARAVPVWESLLAAPERELRDVAKEMIATLRPGS